MLRSGLVLAALFISAVPTLSQEVGGSYEVQGTNLDGSTYGGSAEITLLSETACAIAWTTGPTTSEGICMLRKNTFVAGYQLDGRVGLVVYDVLSDGSLVGNWTIAGIDGSGGETLIPLR